VLALGMVLQRYEFGVDPSYELEIVESLTLKPSGFRLRPRVRTAPKMSVPSGNVENGGAPAAGVRT
jgi:hypothetical protein